MSFEELLRKLSAISYDLITSDFLYLELSLSRIDFLVPCEFEIERFYGTFSKLMYDSSKLKLGLPLYDKKEWTKNLNPNTGYFVQLKRLSVLS